MKKWKVIIEDLGLTLETVYEINTKEEAENMARANYSLELNCEPKDVNIIEI